MSFKNNIRYKSVIIYLSYLSKFLLLVKHCRMYLVHHGYLSSDHLCFNSVKVSVFIHKTVETTYCKKCSFCNSSFTPWSALTGTGAAAARHWSDFQEIPHVQE